MKVSAPEPQLSADKRSLTFSLEWRERSVNCVVARSALEGYFWLPVDADEIRTRKVFSDGFSRIEAVAHRKLLARPTPDLELSKADFSKE